VDVLVVVTDRRGGFRAFRDPGRADAMSTVEAGAQDALRAAQERIARAAEDGDLDQGRAPMLEALRAFHECEPASFSIPAHKAGRALEDLTREVLGEGPYRADAPTHKGLDDRVSSYKVQSYAQELAADTFGADQALFSTNGSTLSVQIAVMAVTHPGQEVAVARNVHKSVISGLILSGARPVFVDPVYDDEYALAHSVTPDALAKALDAHPDAKAMLAVSPTVAGVAADVAALAEVCHDRDVALIMDDAWGADFSFHPELPPGSMESGADLAVASFHKSLTGLMQTSIILVQGERIDMERLQLALDGFETTSTSAMLVASMDAARRAMALHGEQLLDRTLALSRRGGQQIGELPGILLLGPELDGRPGVAARDETKIMIDVTGLGITGFQAADWLYEHRRVGAEHHDLHHLMFIVTVADDEAAVDRLVAAMRDLVDAAPHVGGGRQLPSLPPVSQLVGDYVMSPREAFLGTTRRVDLADAAGEIAAEPVSPYPPGVPLLVPGQRVHDGHVEFLRKGLEAGMFVEGVSDPSLEQLRVVA
jgi:arginine decarboxylase